MIFTKDQIENLLEIIDLHTSMFIVTQMGGDVLSTYDKYILRKFGFNISKITREYPPYLQSFIFGRLTAWLSDNQANSIAYSDFKTYLSSGQYFPLTKKEKSLYDLSISRSYKHIKNLGDKRKDEFTKQLTEEDIRREIAGSFENRTSIQTIISNWGHQTDNWQRDYGRIAETELNTIFQLGRALQIEQKYGLEQRVYKTVYPQACRHCIKLYLTNGIGSQPKIFTLKQLLENGSNVGRRVDEWKAVIESTHPFCRCNLYTVPEGTVWDEEKKMFVYPEKYERKIERKSKVIITVGTKRFEV